MGCVNRPRRSQASQRERGEQLLPPYSGAGRARRRAGEVRRPNSARDNTNKIVRSSQGFEIQISRKGNMMQLCRWMAKKQNRGTATTR